MIVKGRVGDTATKTDGVDTVLRTGRLGDLIISQLHGRSYENVSRGNVYSTAMAATTGGVAAGNINGAAAAASTQFAIWNPSNSGVNLALLKVFVGAISGTPPGGPAFHSVAIGTPNASVGGRRNNNLIGSPTSRALVLESAAGSALTGAPNGLTTFRPMNINLFAAAITATTGVASVLEMVDGDIVLPPGTLWAPTWAAAGTSFLTAYGATWEEVPI